MLLASPLQELHSLQLHEVMGLTPRDIALLPLLTSVRRLSMIASKDDTWLGLAPLRLMTKLDNLKHLDWVPADKALPTKLRQEDLQVSVGCWCSA